MKKITEYFSRNSLLSIALLLSIVMSQTACTSANRQQRLSYDLGLPHVLADKLADNAVIADKRLPVTLKLAEISAAAGLDSNAMLYRLHYANEQNVRPYALHRWSMTPAQLLSQRLKSRLSMAGVTLPAMQDGSTDSPVLSIDLEEFSQIFSSPETSHAQLNLRATLTQKNRPIRQKYFTVSSNATSPDAPGGAKAMQIAVDSMIVQISAWLQQQTKNSTSD